jgi:hypothetical protein
MEIRVEKTGAVQYREDPKDDRPMEFRLGEPDTAAIFALADKLDHFSRPLESGLKVAFMGSKTFRYEDGGDPREVKFNYSEDPEAKTLVDWFERMAETERALIALETAVRFDKLGVQNAILHIETLRDQKRLLAEQQFLPMLDRVAKNEGFLPMARARAAALTDSIRAPK